MASWSAGVFAAWIWRRDRTFRPSHHRVRQHQRHSAGINSVINRFIVLLLKPNRSKEHFRSSRAPPGLRATVRRTKYTAHGRTQKSQKIADAELSNKSGLKTRGTGR